jgi:hypothetical protein
VDVSQANELGQGRVSFLSMPSNDELFRRALARTDEELEEELSRVLEVMRARLAEGGTEEQVEARRQQVAAAERALDRIKRRLGR